jgi:uncharacterized membrane protein
LHFKHIIPPCSLAHGCETVLTSQYATIGPIPIALIGSAYYVILMTILSVSLQNRRELIIKNQVSRSEKKQKTSLNFEFIIHNSKTKISVKNILLTLTTLALFTSILLVGIQAFVLHAFCQYCLGVEGINLILFALIVYDARMN